MIEPTDEMMSAAHEAIRQYGRTECEPDFDEALREAISAALEVQPRTMTPVGLTLVSPGAGDEDPVECDAGLFNQGVLLEEDEGGALVVIDTASGERALYLSNLEGWARGSERYSRLFIHAVPLAAGEIKLSEQVAHDAARIRGFRPSDHTPHDTVGEIYDAAKKLGTDDVEVIVRPCRSES